jgi:lipid-binding SYLF domain-containing protein/peptidoglycan hydrolase-like protein with peptidoglycan-binding domain
MFERKLLTMLCLTAILAFGPAYAVAQTEQEGSDWSNPGVQRDERAAGQMTQDSQDKSDKKAHKNKNKSEVSKVQTALRDQGFDPGPIDGKMGPQTRSALRQFQRQNNLTASGQIDAETRAALGLDASSPEAADAGWAGQEGQDRAGTNGQDRQGTNGTRHDEETRQQGTDHVPPSAHGRSGADHQDHDYDRDRTGQTGTVTEQQTEREGDHAGQSETMTEQQTDRDRDQADQAGTMTDQEAESGERESRDQAELARDAAEVLREITQAPDQGIPNDLLREAKGIAVIPGVIKGAFGIGGRWGEGLMVGRNEDGTWGAPSFIEISGASVGFQIGVSSTDLVLVLTSKDAIDALLDNKLKLGADAAVAAGPVGRSASAGTDVRFEGPIYSYSRSKGAFAGVSLEGAVITIDDSANQKVYGQNVSGTDILREGTVQANATVEPFLDAVRSHTPAQAE